MKFYKCNKCGKVIALLDKGRVCAPTICCGEEMSQLKPKCKDEGKEKHVPFLLIKDRWWGKVSIGEEPHPCSKEHYIQFIVVEFEDEFVIKYLCDNEPPEMEFYIPDGKKVKNVYCYCNIHGLWCYK